MKNTKRSLIENRESEFHERLSEAARLEIKDLLVKYETSIEGKKEESRIEYRKKYGPNKIQTAKKKSLIQRLAKAFFDPFTLILLTLSVISILTDVVFAKSGDKNPVTAIIIILMVAISGFLRFFQETKSGKSSEKLLEMIETTCSVRTPGEKEKEIPVDELVVGDIVTLSAGDMVPADVRILESRDLFVSQSALTGESMTVEKFASLTDETSSVLEMSDLAFMGTNVISGTAVAVVISTGMDTVFGSIAESLDHGKEMTNFEKGINSVSWILIRFMLIMVPVVFFITGITKGHWLNSLLFAISIAVGLTPEMLPMIITTCLSAGSVEMAKNKVIIKNLNSIQSVGAMDVLCTDKTGTLTEDRIALQYHMNIEGKDDTRVLRYGFLNSYYQTGLKNIMDKAIISKTMELQNDDPYLEATLTRYEKCDEIPFDFSRRRMSVVVKNLNKKTKLITKGAIEEIVGICSYAELNNVVTPMDDSIRERVYSEVRNLNSQGMRVIAVCYKLVSEGATGLTIEDEKEMILMGFLSFLDPPKKSTVDAINALKQYGVDVKVLTGDNKEVTVNVCNELGIDSEHVVLGEELDSISDKELSELTEKVSIFAKLSPIQKERIVDVIKSRGKVVGYMGDGINDAAALEKADVGISVSNAVDIAKESADVILLEKDLMVLEKGIIQGRKIYANMLKYIKITASSNFGNVFSILVASIFLPFLPIEPLHLLMLNMIYDISCIAFPWDNVDESYIQKPRKWEAETIPGFMVRFGPVSSVFDIMTFIVLYFMICPAFTGGTLFSHLTSEASRDLYISAFHTGWFIESMLSQTLVIQMLRTSKVPFKESRPSIQLMLLNLAGIIFVLLIPMTQIGIKIGFTTLPLVYYAYLAVIIILYMVFISYTKRAYLKKYHEIL